MGTYSCTITDSNLCDTTVVFIITEPTDFNIVKSQTNLICYGDTNGTATVSVSGPHQIILTNGILLQYKQQQLQLVYLWGHILVQ